MAIGLTLSSFADNMVELWNNLFQGHERFKFYCGFCMVTFGVAFMLIWGYIAWINLYSYVAMRKKYPAEWKWMLDLSRKRGKNKLYKEWIKDNTNCDNPFWRICRRKELFGKICLGVWFVIALSVGVAVLIKKYS